MNTSHGDAAVWTDDELDATLDDLLTMSIDSAHLSDRPGRRRESVGWEVTPLRRRRWAAPAAAAAAVAAVLAGVLAVVGHQQRAVDLRAAAATVVTVDRTADIGGVRFPVPRGWAVTTREAGDTVIACASATPAIPCDGVTLTIAIPGAAPISNTVDDPVLGQNCVGNGGFVRVDGDVTLGGRPAVHYWGGSCTPDGPEAHLWILLDRSLALTTPSGQWAEQGAAIAAGIDLKQWPHPTGPPLIQWTEATRAPSSS